MKKVSFFQSIQFKIIIVFILLLLLAIQVMGSYFAQNLEESLMEKFRVNIDERTEVLKYNLIAEFNKERSEDEDEPSLEESIKTILDSYRNGEVFTVLQVIDTQNRVIGAINQQNLIGKRVPGENGITMAARYGQGRETIVTDTSTGHRMFVKIVPLEKQDKDLVGAIYTEASMEDVYNQLENINRIFLNGTILAVIISAFVGILVARAITKPISEMRKQAMIMSTGDFSQKVNVYGGDEIGQLATSFNDMNDKLRQANHTTEEERRKLSSVLSNMSDGVIATDETGAVTLMNGPASNLMGKTFKEIKGKQLIDVLQLEEQVVDLLDFQETGSITIDFSDDDEFFLIKANFSVVMDENDELNGLITVISDVTEQEKVERERREFVSNVSHELRTPLTTMRSYLEALTDGAWEDKEIAPRFLEVTQNETERMIRLVSDLLQLSKMDHKEQSVYKERVNIVSFFHHIIDRFEMNKNENIIIERQLPKDSLFIWLDKDKIIQVVDNIISNAIKYSPKGGKIKVRIIRVRQKVKVSITDQGVGIATEKLDKIFERFYRADKARSRELGGTGLGLAIAKEIIESHHGQIWAESQEGKGTTVLFTLPLINRKRGNR
ncbi:cell wall metabolism sensor histidine kinase WalK [Aquibacillus rhizosphaerae]|uniref:histidine kinase n=1 Tax=Aquibacillus rhizosphaerae TaxID=3051431 RepID=A0ABT7L8Q5_9BACI|nr:cell wall metabolism sensor histidine kinase WalK [Aquibacillus sp. LR5S19]MDL4840955.1 cell wall metabolism sensor histidine kinase WalK [Aquibacillus sp. LR5S19]